MTNTGTPNESKPFPQTIDIEWVPFTGGELEGPRPTAQCEGCRLKRKAGATLCFACYRAERVRDKALRAAAALNTASDERFQSLLPFEPVNRARLERLRMARAESRTGAQGGPDRFAGRRHRAQIAARQMLERIAAPLAVRTLTATERVARERQFASAIHAAELQLPDAWLPFVVSY